MSLHQQLDAILSELQDTLRLIDSQELTELSRCIAAAPRVFIAGAGRSGLVMRGFAMRLMHLGRTAHVVGGTTTPAIVNGDLLLIGSGSGATASLQASATAARSEGATVALVTAQRDSPLGRLADQIVVIEAPTPKIDTASRRKSVQPMGSLFEQCLALLLDALVIELMPELGEDERSMFDRHANLE